MPRLGWDLEIKDNIPLLVVLDSTSALWRSFTSIRKGRKDRCSLAKSAYIIVRYELSPKHKICVRLAGLAYGKGVLLPRKDFPD